MQFSGMLGHPLEVADFVPHPGIRIERQAMNGNRIDKIACGGEKFLHEIRVDGKEQDVAHQAADGFSATGRVVLASGSGDDAIVDVVAAAATADSGRSITVVTADRGLRDRVEALGATTVGPG